MAKPTIIPEWDTSQINSVEPDATHKAEGWLAPAGVPEKPPFQTFNHWQNNVYEWIKEINIKGLLGYDNATDYVANLSYAVGSDGILYACGINNGPASSIVNPVGDVTGTWQKAGQASSLIIFTASGTPYSKPAGLNFIEVIVIGGGGGGGGVDGQGTSTFTAGGGGGQGGESKKIILASALAASETITVGGGGAGGAGTGGTNGTAGNNSSLGSHAQGGGGGGGDGDVAAATNSVRVGGGGGTAINGDLNEDGAPGQNGVASGAASGRLVSGGGGGKGGGKGVTDALGNDATSPGGGGGGAGVFDASADRDGGDGADGIIIIKEFF